MVARGWFLIMLNLTTPQVLPIGYKPTDADVRNFQAAGLRLVAKPDPVITNVISLDDRRMQICTSPEAA